MCVSLWGEETKGWSLGSALQFLPEKDMNDVSVGVKCGKEGREGVLGPGAGTPNIIRSGWAVRLRGSLEGRMPCQ